MCELYLNIMAIKIPLKYIYLHFYCLILWNSRDKYLILDSLKWKRNTLAFHPCLWFNENRWKEGKAFFKMPVNIKLPNYVAPGPKGILMWCPSLWIKETRSKEKTYWNVVLSNTRSKQNCLCQLNIAICLTFILSVSCVLHIQTQRHTIVKLNNYFQDFFRVTCLLGDKWKASPSYRKTQERRKFICILKLNHNS